MEILYHLELNLQSLQAEFIHENTAFGTKFDSLLAMKYCYDHIERPSSIDMPL